MIFIPKTKLTVSLRLLGKKSYVTLSTMTSRCGGGQKRVGGLLPNSVLISCPARAGISLDCEGVYAFCRSDATMTFREMSASPNPTTNWWADRHIHCGANATIILLKRLFWGQINWVQGRVYWSGYTTEVYSGGRYLWWVG